MLDGLDDAQRQAASSVEGPVRIIACAGAGKTRTITRRIAYGVASGAWDPTRVLAVTFSVKAAGEMRDRLDALQVPRGMRIATFHSAALRQCREAWRAICSGPFPDLIADAKRKREVVAAGVFRATARQPEPQEVADIEREIDWCKVSLITPQAYDKVCAATHREPPAGCDPGRFARIYGEYEAEKTARMGIDYNDILLLASHICDADDEVGHALRSQVGWLTVDEYQDVSPLQHRLMRAWLGENRNVCVVGDPAQTIYSFAGATSYYLASFGREFAPLGADIALRTDYRSLPPIVARANHVLSRSPQRGDYVRLEPAREGTTRVTSAIYGTDEEEAEAVARRIERVIARGGKAGDCAVLTRLTRQQPCIVQALKAHGIPYQVRRDAGWQSSPLIPPPNASAVDSLEALQAGRVTVSTIHASKGLEFPHVYLVGLSDGILPYQGMVSPDHLEEERRLLYVGITRAEDTLHLSYARKQDDQSPAVRSLSRFLA